MTSLDLQFDTRACPLCGHDSPTQILTEGKFDVNQVSDVTFSSRKEPDSMRHRMIVCSHCDLAYANPIPDTSWVQKNYVGAWFESSEESQWAAKNHSRLLDRVLGNLPDRDNALDIGAGDGAFLKVLLQRGFTNVEGVEPSIAAAHKASGEVQGMIAREFFDGDNYESKKYSIVTCFQVLEHIHDIVSLAHSVYRMLKPGGYFLTNSHDYRAWTARIFRERSPIYDIEHLQLFSKISLKNLYESSGYKEVEIRRTSEKFPLAYWLKLSPLPHGAKEIVGRLATQFDFSKMSISLRAGNLCAFGVKSE